VIGSPSSRSRARTLPSSVGTAIWAARRLRSNCDRMAEARSGAMPAVAEGISYSRSRAEQEVSNSVGMERLEPLTYVCKVHPHIRVLL
jgi:hypothetical protein